MHPPLRSRFRTAASASVLIAVGSAAGAAEPRQRPEGLLVGPFVLRPYVAFAYGYDTNVFNNNASETASADWKRRAIPGLGASLPFRNSTLEVDAQASHDNYRDTTLDRKWSLAGSFRLDLAFASSDHLEVVASGNRANTETTLDRGGEVALRGQPYSRHGFGVSMARKEFGHRGYVLQVQTEALKYDASLDAGGLDQSRFFSDFRGRSLGFEYREPLARSHWLTAAVQADRNDYFCRDRVAFADTCGVGRSYRGESADLFWLGMSGQFSNDQPYSARLGWASFRYRHDFLPDYLASRRDFESDYRGIVASVSASFRVAKPLLIVVQANQRPWSSIDADNNYFLQRAVLVNLTLNPRGSEGYGAILSWSLSRYPNRSFAFDGRRDVSFHAEVYATVALRDLLKLRVSVSRQARDSNVEDDPVTDRPELDYDGMLYAVGLVFGWGDR